jgi:hypothetical protein
VQDPRDDVSGEKQVADDMLQFLQEFFEGKPWVAGMWMLSRCLGGCAALCATRVLLLKLMYDIGVLAAGVSCSAYIGIY